MAWKGLGTVAWDFSLLNKKGHPRHPRKGCSRSILGSEKHNPNLEFQDAKSRLQKVPNMPRICHTVATKNMLILTHVTFVLFVFDFQCNVEIPTRQDYLMRFFQSELLEGRLFTRLFSVNTHRTHFYLCSDRKNTIFWLPNRGQSGSIGVYKNIQFI